jgi:hypothetical protein
MSAVSGAGSSESEALMVSETLALTFTSFNPTGGGADLFTVVKRMR